MNNKENPGYFKVASNTLFPLKNNSFFFEKKLYCHEQNKNRFAGTQTT